LVFLYIGRLVILYQHYPFDQDEAVHANNGLMLALDLSAGDPAAFLADSYRQAYYPPVFSWLRAVAYLLFGATPLVARLVSGICLFAAVLVIYAIGLQLDERRGWLIGLLAAGLTLTAQPLLSHAGLSMLETPGLLISFALLWAYLRATKEPSPHNLLLTSLFLTLTFLTKYTYGLAALATVAIVELLSLLQAVQKKESGGKGASLARPLPPNPTIKRWLWLFGPFLVLILLWFATPEKLAGLQDYIGSQPPGDRFSRESLLFYPRSILLHYAPSTLFALLFLAAVLWAIWHWRDERLRPVWLYLLIGLLEMTINPQKTPRFIATYVPAVYLLVGAMIAANLKSKIQNPKSKIPSPFAPRSSLFALRSSLFPLFLALSTLTAVPVLVERFRALPQLLQIEYETSPEANTLADWLLDQTAGQRFYLINPWDQFSATMLEWERASRLPPAGRFAEAAIPWLYLTEARPEAISDLRRQILESGVDYVVALEGGPAGGPYWPEYAPALGDVLVFSGRQQFSVVQYQVGNWLNRSRLTSAGLAQAMAEREVTFIVQVTVYKVTPSGR
jgi:hypothetical protein